MGLLNSSQNIHLLVLLLISVEQTTYNEIHHVRPILIIYFSEAISKLKRSEFICYILKHISYFTTYILLRTIAIHLDYDNVIEPSFGHDKLKIQPVDMSRFLIWIMPHVA